METVATILRYSLFEITTVLGAVILSLQQPKRKYAGIFFLLGIGINVGFVLFLNMYARNHWGGFYADSFRYLGQFLLVLFMVYACLDCGMPTAMFVATMAYGMQQLSNRLYGAFIEWLMPGQNWTIPRVILLIGSIAIVFSITEYFFFKRSRESGYRIQIENPVQLSIMTLALIVMIFVEQISLPMIRSVTDPVIRIANYFSSASFALLIIMLEMNVLKKHDVEQELIIIRRMLEEERKQYEKEKDVVDIINVKCHDLKHQLNAIEEKIPNSEREQIRQAVRQYDSTVRTGNPAMDVVLTMKKMICEDRDIELSCILDGNLLAFMEEQDIYSLFGNLLDNAIEEVSNFDKEYRVIGLTVRREKQFVLIHEENYIRNPLQIENGLPKTTKGDSINHGFGIRSMQMMAEKYNGHFMIHSEDGVFRLNIMLPIPQPDGMEKTA